MNGEPIGVVYAASDVVPIGEDHDRRVLPALVGGDDLGDRGAQGDDLDRLLEADQQRAEHLLVQDEHGGGRLRRVGGREERRGLPPALMLPGHHPEDLDDDYEFRRLQFL